MSPVDILKEARVSPGLTRACCAGGQSQSGLKARGALAERSQPPAISVVRLDLPIH